MSEPGGTPELNAALAKAQGEFEPIKKEKTAKTASFSYSYASLDTFLDKCRPILAKHGIAIVQPFEILDGANVLRTELRHTSGEMICSVFLLQRVPDTDQQLGSMLTYLRRYTLAALLGVAAEEDDDAQSSTAKPRKAKEKPVPPSKEQEETFYKPEPVTDQLSASQNRLMHGLFTSKGIKERSDRLDYVMRVLGRPVGSSTELSKQDAKKVIDHLEQYDKNIEATWP